MKRIAGAAALLSFLFALGIVGAVERGADLSLMWWTLPALGVLWLAPRIAEHKGRRSRPHHNKLYGGLNNDVQ